METLSEINWSGGYRTGSSRILLKSLLWKKTHESHCAILNVNMNHRLQVGWEGVDPVTPFPNTLGFLSLLRHNCGFLFNLFSLFYSLIFGGCNKWYVSLWILAVWFWYCCTLYCLINMFIRALETGFIFACVLNILHAYILFRCIICIHSFSNLQIRNTT